MQKMEKFCFYRGIMWLLNSYKVTIADVAKSCQEKIEYAGKLQQSLQIQNPNVKMFSKKIGYLVSERKPGVFSKIKEGENYNHRNTLSISRIYPPLEDLFVYVYL